MFNESYASIVACTEVMPYIDSAIFQWKIRCEFDSPLP